MVGVLKDLISRTELDLIDRVRMQIRLFHKVFQRSILLARQCDLPSGPLYFPGDRIKRQVARRNPSGRMD